MGFTAAPTLGMTYSSVPAPPAPVLASSRTRNQLPPGGQATGRRTQCRLHCPTRLGSCSSRGPGTLGGASGASPSFWAAAVGAREGGAHRFVMAASSSLESGTENVFFDGGPHIGDLAVNLAFGLTGVWLPLTLTAVFRCLFLRYRFTDRRVTIVSSISDSERKDFPYSAIVDVKSIPRFIGEWGDLAITLSDKTIVELKSVPRFREVAKYCQERAAEERGAPREGDVAGPGGVPKGF